MSLSKDPPSPATTQHIDDESRNLKPRAKPTDIIKHTNENIALYKKVTATSWAKKEKEKVISHKVTENNLQNEEVNNNTESEVPTKAQRTIDIATAVVRINKRFTTPVTLEIRPSNGASNLNVAQAHRNIFMSLKLIEPTAKFITPGNITIDSHDDFPSEASKYTSMFHDFTKCPKTSRVYISFKIESSRSLGELKHGNNTHLENIFDTLKKNNAFLRHEKFKSHKEHSLGFFVDINPRVTLRETLRRRIQDQLMWIDLEDEDCKDMIHQDLDTEGKPTGKVRILISVFDLHSREVGDGNGKDRVTTFAYEIRRAPTKAYMLKNILCKISSEDPHFKFIPYGLNTITTDNTMRRIILTQNTFLSNMAIVPINGILQKDELEVMESFKRSVNFTAMEPTRKSSEGRWLLITTNKNLYNARREADEILVNYQHEEHHISKSIRNNPSTRNTATNHFSTYAAALSQTMTKNDNSTMITSPPNQYKRPVTISFNSYNNNSTHETPPKQKRKLQTDISIITNTTEDCNSYPPLCNSQTQSTWKDDVSTMMEDMKDDIMTQVQSLFEVQMKEAIRVMQDDITGMVKEVVNTLVAPLIQQHVNQTLNTETRSRKRMGKNSSNESNTDESEEEEYSEEMEDSNSSGDEGTPINAKYKSNRNKKKAHKAKLHKKTMSRQGKNVK